MREIQRFANLSHNLCENDNQTLHDYRKIPKISPSKYKPPQTGKAKNPPLNSPSKYKPPRGLYLESCPQIQSKTKQKRQIYFQL